MAFLQVNTAECHTESGSTALALPEGPVRGVENIIYDRSSKGVDCTVKEQALLHQHFEANRLASTAWLAVPRQAQCPSRASRA